MARHVLKFIAAVISVMAVLCKLTLNPACGEVTSGRNTSEPACSEKSPLPPFIKGGIKAEKIAFLRNGEVWVCDKDGRGLRQVTETAGKVEDFLFSPTLKYLAYSKVMKYVDEPGLWEESETVPQRAVCSIVIMGLKSREVLKEIMPPEDNWIYPARWLPDGKLLFYAASGFDVWGFFEYDIRKGVETELDYTQGSVLLEADFHGGESLKAYVDDTGLGEDFKENLHIVDMRSDTDRILVSMRSILDPKISHRKKSVAFVEVDYVDKEGRDNLWVCNIRDGSLKKLYEGPARAKIGGVSELAWSFDDRYIGMFFPPEAVVLEVENPADVHKIRGTDFHWIADKKLAFAQGNNIYLYDLDTRERRLLLKDATKPVFLRQSH
ncbi:MAG: hypothetical protein HY801_15790 [Candidatus Lindowbacteria bacterium]|nr:hypothetical protein [Candidatus Lindowbacteria bacterium]